MCIAVYNMQLIYAVQGIVLGNATEQTPKAQEDNESR